MLDPIVTGAGVSSGGEAVDKAGRMQKPVSASGRRRWRLAFHYLRANGLRRFLLLLYVHLVSPKLEPFRNIGVSVLMLPRRYKVLLLMLATIIYFVLAVLLPPWSAIPLFVLTWAYIAYRYGYPKLQVALRVRNWELHKDQLLEATKGSYVLTVDHLGLAERGLGALRQELQEASEVTIAHIDQDGFLSSRFGPIAGATNVDSRDFFERKRRRLSVQALGNQVVVRKQYGDRRDLFVNELGNLHALTGHCNVPGILDADFEERSLAISYIPGPVIREELAKGGAVLRDRDIVGNPDFAHLSRKDRNRKRIEEGRRVLDDCIAPELVERIFIELKKIHKAGICVGDLKYGNIVIERESGEPYFVDFEHSRNYGGPSGLQWEIRRDRDIERFNLHFGTEKLTRARILQRLHELSLGESDHRHGSVNFGRGIATGGIWNTELGEGRWRNVLQPGLPQVSGKRVLDLGCGDAYFSLQMLRHGAQEVIGIESHPAQIKRSVFIKEAFEWADSSTYGFKQVPVRMEDVLTRDLGRFDLVTALKGLCHVDPELIDRVVGYVSEITDCFVVLCQEDPTNGSLAASRRKTADYYLQVLERHGFDVGCKVPAPGYSWSLVTGTRP